MQLAQFVFEESPLSSATAIVTHWLLSWPSQFLISASSPVQLAAAVLLLIFLSLLSSSLSCIFCLWLPLILVITVPGIQSGRRHTLKRASFSMTHFREDFVVLAVIKHSIADGVVFKICLTSNPGWGCCISGLV